MSSSSDLRFGRIAVSKNFLTEDVLTEVFLHQAADALAGGGVAKPLYQVAYDGGWLEEDQVQAIRLAQRFQEFLEGEKELADLVVKHGIAERDLVEEILNRQRDLWKETQGKPPGLATMLASEAELDEKEQKALRTLEKRLRKEAEGPTVVKVVTGPAALPPLPPGMAPPPTPTPSTPSLRSGTKSGKPKCPSCQAPLSDVAALSCDACGALFCPSCRAVIQVDDTVCGSCHHPLRLEEPEPKSRKGLIAAVVLVVLLGGAGIALGPGGLYRKLAGASRDYAQAVEEANDSLKRVDGLIDQNQEQEARDALAAARGKVEALAGKVDDEQMGTLRYQAKLREDAIALLAKRLEERRQQEEAARKEKERHDRSHALVAEAAKASDPAKARTLLEQALHLVPENGAAWHQLGLVLDRMGKRDRAMKLLADAGAKGQLGTLALVLLGRWDREAKDWEGTRKWLNAVFSVPPAADAPETEENQKAVSAARRDAHRMLVLTEMEDPKGSAAEALNHFREMGDWSGMDPEILLMIADLYRKRDEKSRAVDLYKAHLEAHRGCKRRLILEWTLRRLTGDDSQDKADLVVIKESPTVAYFLSAEKERDTCVRNLPDDAEEVDLPRDACEVKRGQKNPLSVAFDLFDKRLAMIPYDQVGKRCEKLQEFINEAVVNHIPPAVIKRICEAELLDLQPRAPGDADLKELLAAVEKWSIPPPSVKPPPPEQITPIAPQTAHGGSGNGGPTTPQTARTFDADRVWTDLFASFKRGKEKFADPAKAAERQALEDEALRVFREALNNARPAENSPARKWYEKFVGWARPVAQTFMGDWDPKKPDSPFVREADTLSRAAADLAMQCIQASVPPATPTTPQQALDALLADVVSVRKQFPGQVKFYVVLANGQSAVANTKPSGTAYLRRDALDVRRAAFKAELAAAAGGSGEDTVRLKEKALAAVAARLPVETPLDRFNYEKFTAVDYGEDATSCVRGCLDEMLEKVRKQ